MFAVDPGHGSRCTTRVSTKTSVSLYRRRATRGILVLLSMVASCTGRPEEVARVGMFTLGIGKMEDQLDLIQRAGEPFDNDITLDMRNGIFTVADPRSRKIMQFNSYGDLLMLLYDPRTNPEPVFVSAEQAPGMVTNRRAYPFAFHAVGSSATTADGTLFVEDEVDSGDEEFDAAASATLRYVVRRFSSDGTPSSVLGQEGTNGRPFPRIQRLFAAADGGVVVVCRTSIDWRVYAFRPDSSLRYSAFFDPDELRESRGVAEVSIDEIIPDPAGETVYLKVDYYEGDEDLDYTFSEFLPYAPESRTWRDSIRIPVARTTAPNERLLRTEGVEVLYQFVGVAAGGFLYALAPTGDSTYRMLIVTSEGETVYVGSIGIEDEQTLLRSFVVTTGGILGALTAGPLGADVAIWRFDEIIDEARYEDR
jgi:hypothetical protein